MVVASSILSSHTLFKTKILSKNIKLAVVLCLLYQEGTQLGRFFNYFTSKIDPVMHPQLKFI